MKKFILNIVGAMRMLTKMMMVVMLVGGGVYFSDVFKGIFSSLSGEGGSIINKSVNQTKSGEGMNRGGETTDGGVASVQRGGRGSIVRFEKRYYVRIPLEGQMGVWYVLPVGTELHHHPGDNVVYEFVRIHGKEK